MGPSGKREQQFFCRLDKPGSEPILKKGADAMTVKRFLLLFLLALVCNPGSGRAAEPAQIMHYDVYAGGIHAMTGRLRLEQDKTRYNVELEAATIGFVRKLAPWSGIFTTTGWTLGRDNFQPEKHVSASTWKGDIEKKIFKFKRSGGFKSYEVTENGKDSTPDKLDPKLVPRDVSDILSATLEVMGKLGAGGQCAGSSVIFDGDRTFKMVFAGSSTENLPKSSYNIYEGPATSCTIEVKPYDGKWHKKPRGWLSLQEQGRKAGTMPTVWFTKLSSKSGAPYIPVKVSMKTDYGTLVMHLTSYQGPDGAKQSVSVK
jgi:hypothetical protein